MRLDRWFKRRWPHLNHIQIKKLVRSGQIRVDGARAKADTRLAAGAQVRVPPLPDAPTEHERERERNAVSPRDAAFARSLVLYEDEEVLVLNKPAGLAVQGGTKTTKHVDRLLGAWGEGLDRPAPGPPARPRHLRRAGAGQDAQGRRLPVRRLRQAARAQDLLGHRRRQPAPDRGRDRASPGQEGRRRPRAGRARRPQGARRRARRDRVRHHLRARPSASPGWRCAPTPAAPTSCAPT